MTRLLGWEDRLVVAVEAARRRPYALGPQSTIYVDPTIRRDEIASIHDELPTIAMSRKSRKGHQDSTEIGHAAVNAALMDADRNVRLTFASSVNRLWGKLIRKL